MSLRISDRVQQIGPTLKMQGQLRTHVLLEQGHVVISVGEPAARLIRDLAVALIEAGILEREGSSVNVRTQQRPSPQTVQDHVAQQTSGGRWHLFDPERLLGTKQHTLTASFWVWPLFLLTCGALLISLYMSGPHLQQRAEQLLNMPLGWLGSLLLVFLGIVVHELAHAWGVIRTGGRCRSIGFALTPVPGMYADVKAALLLPDRTARAGVYFAGLFASAAWAAIMLQTAEWLAAAFNSLAWAAVFSSAGYLTAILLFANAIPWRGSDMHRALSHLRIPVVEDAPCHSCPSTNRDTNVSTPLSREKE